MAVNKTAKKTSPAKKSTTKPQADIKNEQIIEKPVVVAPKKFDQSDVILCRSIVAGELILNGSKSGSKYVWSDLGDITEVEYRDLVGLVRSSSDYINKPYFIIEDEDFLNEFPRIRNIYESLYTIGDLKDVLRLPERQMVSTIESLPDGARNSIQNLAATMITNGQLDSVNKIKTLDKLFGTQLMVLTGLVD